MKLLKLPLGVLFVSSSALAHIQLDSPTVRYSNDGGEVNKSCPCGGGGGNQNCTNGVTSDDGRDESRVTAVAPGSTVTIQWTETVGHTGRFRVAFDDDGADLADFNANILADIADPSDGGGARFVEVTLPDVECENCTLQLIQDMNGNTDDAVADPTGDPTYFQCADLALRVGAPSEITPPVGSGCACSSTSTSATFAALSALLLGRLSRQRRR